MQGSINDTARLALATARLGKDSSLTYSKPDKPECNKSGIGDEQPDFGMECIATKLLLQ